ncbi:helix-turn-helix transcriptional regulator [Legionella pneumophila serogroup 1]
MILKEFGKIVRSKRKDMALSQEKLADLAGLHRTYIGMIERGEKNITLTNIEKISRALHCSISDLMRNL